MMVAPLPDETLETSICWENRTPIYHSFRGAKKLSTAGRT